MSTAVYDGCVASSTDDAGVTAVVLSGPRSRQRSIAKQYDEAAQQTYTHTDEPYKITWGSRIFVISGTLNKRKSRGRRSWITREDWFLTELTTTGKVKQDVWCCRRCEDEIDRYYNMKVGGSVDPVEWWIGNRAQFPKLSQMALDILAIPAMAVDCERSFSIAKLTLSSQRHAMKWETIEMF